MIVVLIVLSLIAILVPLIPFGSHADTLVFPDLLLPLMVAWTVRRPDASLCLLYTSDAADD